MSDTPTPRTDANEITKHEYGDWGAPDIHKYVSSEFARQLERELAAERETSRLLREQIRVADNAFNCRAEAAETKLNIAWHALKFAEENSDHRSQECELVIDDPECLRCVVGSAMVKLKNGIQ